MLSNFPQWVAVYVSSRAEKRVDQRLVDCGIESYLPLVAITRRWSDRWKVVDLPLIPSYLFAKITAKQLSLLRSVPGVAYVVAWNGDVAVIPNKEIESIKRIVDARAEVFVRNNNELKKGTKVCIMQGQFMGMEGRLVSHCKDGNFSVEISGLQFSLVMTIEKAILKAIPEK